MLVFGGVDSVKPIPCFFKISINSSTTIGGLQSLEEFESIEIPEKLTASLPLKSKNWKITFYFGRLGQFFRGVVAASFREGILNKDVNY